MNISTWHQENLNLAPRKPQPFITKMAYFIKWIRTWTKTFRKSDPVSKLTVLAKYLIKNLLCVEVGSVKYRDTTDNFLGQGRLLGIMALR